jgi:hypothetical protein
MKVMFTTQLLVPRSVYGWKFTPTPPTHLVVRVSCTRSKFKNSLIINIILQHHVTL